MTAPTPEPVVPRGLLARAIGVFLAPRETYADVVRRPRPFPALVVVLAIIAATLYFFLSSDVGQRAWMDQALTQREAFGQPVTPEVVAALERIRPIARSLAVGAVLVIGPLMIAALSGILFVVFNAILGGSATYNQVFAIVVHSGFIAALQQVFVAPLNYARETMSSATSLAAFAPMVDSASFVGMLLGSIDFFQIWSLISVSIGLAVLYKRRTAPIAWSLLGVGFVIVLILASVKTVLSGA